MDINGKVSGYTKFPTCQLQLCFKKGFSCAALVCSIQKYCVGVMGMWAFPQGCSPAASLPFAHLFPSTEYDVKKKLLNKMYNVTY